MKRALIVVSLLAGSMAFAGAPDPAYLKAFGQGTVAVSFGGKAELGKYDPAQFNYKDGRFIVPGGEDATLDLRALLPKGMTIGKALAKTKKARGGNAKYRQADFMAWPSGCRTTARATSCSAPRRRGR